MEIPRREVRRYLRWPEERCDAATEEAITRCCTALEQVQPRFVMKRMPLAVQRPMVEFDGLSIESNDLSANLDGCCQIVVFAATLGTQADRMLARAAVRSVLEGAVMQAAAAAMIEEYCDTQNAHLCNTLRQEGFFLRPRFSPGYGDFSIHWQQELLRLLDAAKAIGLSLTEGMVMTPVKSVSALIGLSRQEILPSQHSRCASCSMENCTYRRT